MKIEYELNRAGWAVAKVSTNETTVTMTVSYLHDTLCDLADAALNLGADANKAVVVFMNEPGEYQMVLEKFTVNTVRATLYQYSGWNSWDMGDSKPNATLLQAQIDVVEFQNNVFDILEGLLIKHGAKGYKEAWVEHDFPIRLYGRLKRKLRR